MKKNRFGRNAALATSCFATFFVMAQTGCHLEPEGGSPSPTAQGEANDNSASAEKKTVSVKVNTMTCVAGCFNGIQTVLKKRPGIDEVKLAPQKNDEGNVDNSVIYITYKGDLDRNEVERTIVGAGFESIEFLD